MVTMCSSVHNVNFTQKNSFFMKEFHELFMNIFGSMRYEDSIILLCIYIVDIILFLFMLLDIIIVKINKKTDIEPVLASYIITGY
jgi:hypothetical protein